MGKQSFPIRLERAKKLGRLTTADLMRWFDRPYRTVWGWSTYSPWGPAGEEAEKRLCVLERLIREHRGRPLIPTSLSPVDRIAYLEGMKHALDGRVPQARAAE